MSDALFVAMLYRGRIAVAQGLEKTCLGVAAAPAGVLRQPNRSSCSAKSANGLNPAMGD
jgi:hypothetical protein